MADTALPSDAVIKQVAEICNITTPEAISRLMANNNDPEAAINEYYTNPGSNKYDLSWDETAFNTDREGGVNEAVPSFNIQGADELPSVSHVKNAAPTRPPSRTNNRSPLGPTNATQEDADLARAIAESAAESGVIPQQDGIIDNGTSSKHFGPANRSDYEADKWAMIPSTVTPRLSPTNPPPSNRKRDADAPAFLRQTKLHRLGGILSIYNQIPLARNFLLRCGRPLSMYGQDPNWWTGNPILRQIVLQKLNRGEEIWGEDQHPDFVEELHRLLAFLDSSERSYASADGLADTKAIDPTFGGWMPDVEEKLFQALHEASTADPNCGIEDMTTTGKIIPVIPPSSDGSELSGQEDEEDNTTSFIFLDIALDFESYSRVDTMYDALDHLLWSSALSLDYSFPQNARTAVLLKPGEVLTMRFGGSGFTKPCEIPEVFYADRYMNDRKDISLRLQTQMRQIRNALEKLAWAEVEHVSCPGELCRFNVPGLGEKHDARQCCQKMMDCATVLLERQNRDAQWRFYEDKWEHGTPYTMNDLRLISTWSGPSNLANDERSDQEKWQHIIQVCKDKIEEVDQGATGFQRKREELNNMLNIVRKRLTCQEHEADDDCFVFRSTDAYRPEYWDPSTKYLLRGVATTPDIAYVCVRDDGPFDSEITSVPKDQWWKVGYVASDASPIKCEKVTCDDVVQAAGTDSKNPILVYASEAALSQKRIPLSDALRVFIKHDNHHFQQELAEETSSQQTNDQDVQMTNQPPVGVTAAALSQLSSEVGTGGKRKYSIGSSVATNGSIRSRLADVELSFDDTRPVFSDVTEPTDGELPEQKAKGEVRAPEMSERRGGGISFLSPPDTPAHNPIDLMDLDAENDLGGG